MKGKEKEKEVKERAWNKAEMREERIKVKEKERGEGREHGTR